MNGDSQNTAAADKTVPSAMEQKSEHCAMVVGERQSLLVECRFSKCGGWSPHADWYAE